jgi:uncharacterized protein YneF (UPF0154 family)
MSKFSVLMYILFPLVTFLGVYGIFLAASIKKTGWDLKGILIVLCFILPGLGFFVTLIVRRVRHKRLKKQEIKEYEMSKILSLASNQPIPQKVASSGRIRKGQVKTFILALFISAAVYLFFRVIIFYTTYKYFESHTRNYPKISQKSVDSLYQIMLEEERQKKRNN